jgi:hypothetical protein
MKMEDCWPLDQTFTFVAHDGSGVTFHLNSTALLRDIRSGKVAVKAERINLPPDLAQHVNDMHGVERDRVEQIMRSIQSGKDDAPPALVVENEGYHIIADGNHHVAAAAALGMDAFSGYIVPKGKWEPYCIDDVPAWLSGLIVDDVAQQWENLPPMKRADKHCLWHYGNTVADLGWTEDIERAIANGEDVFEECNRLAEKHGLDDIAPINPRTK